MNTSPIHFLPLFSCLRQRFSVEYLNVLKLLEILLRFTTVLGVVVVNEARSCVTITYVRDNVGKKKKILQEFIDSLWAPAVNDRSRVLVANDVTKDFFFLSRIRRF